MSLTAHKEQLSFAYIEAIASAAKFAVIQRSKDVGSVDLEIAPFGSTSSFPLVFMQLKCTADQTIIHKDAIHFPLQKNNFTALRQEKGVAKILVVMIVPNEEQHWVVNDESCLTMRRSAYWRCLYDEPESENKDSITVKLPRRNLFTTGALKMIMDRVEQGSSLCE